MFPFPRVSLLQLHYRKAERDKIESEEKARLESELVELERNSYNVDDEEEENLTQTTAGKWPGAIKRRVSSSEEEDDDDLPTVSGMKNS